MPALVAGIHVFRAGEKREACIVGKRSDMSRKLKPIPAFRDEAEERQFWEIHDSSDYVDWGKAKHARFPNLKPSTVSISLRLPLTLLERIKIAANKRDMPYQSLIKAWLAEKADAN
jgi:predicted DNA binding CopG/RHH family protein